ncbi:IS256 family transposase [candidate division KSB1 bacterium]|nr:MAG: IS256 family transposase [candidate division KSB1 bacterium]MCE7942472.1 IS256 family transposase [Chlorobi bacterium CHB1]MDL1877192.1 IS256 family transposase [Cytophagia bacterium CHB2]
MKIAKTQDIPCLPPRRKAGRWDDNQHPLPADTKIAMIQLLIPIALEQVGHLLSEEVQQLAGSRYARDNNRHIKRWGQQRGSVYLGDPKVHLMVPRVRDVAHNCEIPLATYQQFDQPRTTEEQLFVRILHGLSCLHYRRAAQLVPQAFGLSKSSISRRFVRASEKKLQALLHRRLDSHEFVALVLDGKTLRHAQMVIALGLTKSGEKMILGFLECASENQRVVSEFLEHLIARGLNYPQGLLVVIDGSKGLRKAITDVFGAYAAIQRCQWHKRENVVAYLPKSQQPRWRQKLQAAYEQPTYARAKEELLGLRAELKQINQSAVASLDEGVEETLALHRLGLFKELGVSLKTTNMLESINAQIAQMISKVSRWRNSDQRQRWTASALLEIEPSLRRIKGFRHLPQLQEALQRELKIVITAAA